MESNQEDVAENSEDNMETVFLPKEVLAALCCMVNFTQLKLLRLVCREWNVQVSTHPRIRNCTGVLRQDWIYTARGLNFESTLPWKSVYFHFFPFNRNSLFRQYWEATGQNVTKLQFRYVKISCGRMMTLLMAMPNLVDVAFRQCSFETTKERIQENPEWSTTIRILRSACPHAGFVLPEGSVMPPPRIRRLEFFKEDYFPLCLLGMLVARSAGVLEELKYDHARLARWRRQYIRPRPELVEDQIFAMVRNSANVLRRFSYFRNFRGDLFLDRLSRQNVILRLDTLQLGQQASWTEVETADAFMQYLNTVNREHLRELTWRFIHRFNGITLSAAIALKTQLRYLFIDTVWCTNRHGQGQGRNVLDFNVFLPLLTNLETLHVRDRNRRNSPSMNTAYLDVLPQSVRTLSFYSYYLPDLTIRTFVQGDSASRLSTLAIEGGRYVTNETMQLIISTLQQLEVLCVNDSRYLTDSGVTGLSDEACKNIIYCNQRSILTRDLDPRYLTGNPISDMKNLRKLSFANCRKLSDISVVVGIKFPFIEEVDLSRCLNVTDFGLIALARNNPTLERIVVMKNYKITHLGLNLVLAANDAIGNIHTSKKVRNRNLGKQLPYPLVDRLATAVTYCRWDERRARPMNTD